MMRMLKTLFWSLAVLFTLQGVVSAETFRVVDDEWLWFSANLEKTDGAMDAEAGHPAEPPNTRLGDVTYDRYFERYGKPPAYDFLQRLSKDVQGARIDGKNIVFLKTGTRVPLKTDLVPSEADRASPYLMETPDTKRVLVVYPYYFYGGKDNEHRVELYSEDGSFLHRFDSLPTHAVKENPHLLIAPERSGCCDALTWRIRFYDLKKGAVSEYGCPEGACGDLLFVKLAQDGTFLVGVEIMGSHSGLGAFLQTSLFIIRDNGLPLASGKIIHVFGSPSVHKRNIQVISPFSISKLSSAEPIKAGGGALWRLDFREQGSRTPLLLNGNNDKDGTPAVVFLIPKDTGLHRTIRFNNQEIASLPAIVICESGSVTLSDRTSRMMNRVTVALDRVNSIIF